MERLIRIQSKLIAPKNKSGNGVKYNFRSAEGILEVLKPLLFEEKLCLVMSDEIILQGGFPYVKSTCKLFDGTGKQLIESSGVAREEKGKLPMAAGQLTGATSSYARKYALGALFLCDDTKDIDHYASQQSYQQSTNDTQRPQQPQKAPVRQYTQQQYNDMRQKLTSWSIENQDLSLKWLNYYKVNGVNQLNNSQILEMGMKIFKK